MAAGVLHALGGSRLSNANTGTSQTPASLTRPAIRSRRPIVANSKEKPMGAARYVGRVGTLAVALGIGAAIANGQGVALASPTSTGSSAQGSDSSSTSGSSTGGSANAGDSSGNSDGTSKADTNGAANTRHRGSDHIGGRRDSASDVDDSASDAKGSSNEDGSTTQDGSSQGVDTTKDDVTTRQPRSRSSVSSSLARFRRDVDIVIGVVIVFGHIGRRQAHRHARHDLRRRRRRAVIDDSAGFAVDSARHR